MIFLVGVPVTLLGGYLLPRWLTVPRAERVVERLHPLLTGWTALLGIVLPSRSADPSDDVRTLAREGSASGVGGEELVMVGGVMTFAGRPVREVMTPRTEVVAIPQDAGYSDAEVVFAESGYTRLPMYGATLDEIVGMVHAFDLFKYQPGDPLPLRPVSFAPALRSAGDVLLDMQRERQHFAVVVDEFGGTAGIVTLEDLLEALVGEIADEDAAAPATPIPAGDLLELDGSVAPLTVAEHFGVDLPVTYCSLVRWIAGRTCRPDSACRRAIHAARPGGGRGAGVPDADRTRPGAARQPRWFESGPGGGMKGSGRETGELVALVREGRIPTVVDRAWNLAAADLADVLAALPEGERRQVVAALPARLAAHALIEMPSGSRPESMLSALGHRPLRAADRRARGR